MRGGIGAFKNVTLFYDITLVYFKIFNFSFFLFSFCLMLTQMVRSEYLKMFFFSCFAKTVIYATITRVKYVIFKRNTTRKNSCICVYLLYILYIYSQGKWLRPLKWKQSLFSSFGLSPRHIFQSPTLLTSSFDQWGVLKLTMLSTKPISMNIGPGRK